MCYFEQRAYNANRRLTHDLR